MGLTVALLFDQAIPLQVERVQAEHPSQLAQLLGFGMARHVDPGRARPAAVGRALRRRGLLDLLDAGLVVVDQQDARRRGLAPLARGLSCVISHF